MPLPSYDPATEVLARWSDGQVRTVPIEQAADIDATGGQILSAEESQAQLAEEARREESESFQGQVRTGAGAVVSGILAPIAATQGATGEQAASGVLGAIEEAFTGRDTTLQNYELMRRDAEYNPTIQMLGSTVGTTLTGSLVGGGIGGAGTKLSATLGGDALATNLATGGVMSQLAGRGLAALPTAVGTLAENTLGGIGAANEQAFLENRELAADEVVGAGLVGAGLGMGVGVGARGLGYAGQKLGQAAGRLVPEGVLQSVARKASYIDAADGALAKVTNRISGEESGKIGQLLLDKGVTGKTAKEAVDILGSEMSSVGQRKGAIEALAAPHFSADEMLSKLRAHADELKNAPPDVARLAKDVTRQADHLEAVAKAGNTDVARNALEETMAARNSIGEALEAAKAAKDKAKIRAYKRMYADVSESIEGAINRADDALGSRGGLSADWKALNGEYRTARQASDLYESRIAKELKAKPGFSFGDSHLGQGAAVMGSVLTGNPLTGALLGVGTAAGRKLVREKGMSFLARAADAMAQRGEIPTVTKMLAVSSQARQQLGKYAVGQLVQQGARRITAAAEEAPAGFAFGALANYSDPRQVADQYTSVTTALRNSDGDIEGMASRANEHLGALASEQPELAAAAQMKMANAIGYLRENMPPEPPSSVLAMAAGTQSKRLPPSNEQVSWLKRYRATVDPSVVYGEIARGHINPETIETLQTLYPAYLASVQMGTLEALNSMPGAIAKLPYSRRLALDTLMGSTGQVEPTRRFTVQDRLAQANAEATQASGPQAPSSRKAPDIAQFGVTTSARLMST